MYRLSFFLVLLLLTLPSCRITPHAIDLSIEFNRQQYKIKGSKVPSRNAARPGLNFALMSLENLNKILYDEGPEDQTNSGIEDNTIVSTENYMSGFNFATPEAQSLSLKAKANKSNLPKELYVMGGIELALKASDDAGEKINLFYFGVPLYALYVKELSHGKIYGGLGPYFAYGLGGKSTDLSGGVTQKFNSFDKDLGFKRFDAGLGITAGYSFSNGIDVRLDYTSGFANIGRDNEKITNKTFGAHAMYTLN